jgi:hypothetical protein
MVSVGTVIVRVRVFETVAFGLELSMTDIDTLKVPETEGVPLNTPVVLLIVNPLGSPVALQV